MRALLPYGWWCANQGASSWYCYGSNSDGNNYTVLPDIQGLEDHFEIWTLRLQVLRRITALQWISRSKGSLQKSWTEALLLKPRKLVLKSLMIKATIPEVRPQNWRQLHRKLIPLRLMWIRSRLSSVSVEKPSIRSSLKQELRSTKKGTYLSILKDQDATPC